MGSCISNTSSSLRYGSTEEFGVVVTAKVVGLDGSMAQFCVPVKVHDALGDRRSSCFLCSSDELYHEEPIPALDMQDSLQMGQLYFVLPLSMLLRPLPGRDMATLAVKASTALQAAGVSFQGKNGGGATKGRQMSTRVAPLIVISNGTPSDGAYEHDAEKTIYKDQRGENIRMRKGVGYSNGRRHSARITRLSIILEGSE